jgi:hypothetical protein
MKRNIIVSSHSITLTLVTDMEQESEAACSLFGPARAGLITSQGTLGAQHTELLNSCLRSLEILQSKYYTDSSTLRVVTQEALVKHLPSTLDTTGTDVNL